MTQSRPIRTEVLCLPRFGNLTDSGSRPMPERAVDGASKTRRRYPWPILLCGAAVSFVLAACSAIPGSGPRTADIEDGAKTAGSQTSPSYVLINLDQGAAQVVSAAATAQRAEEPIMLPPGRRSGLVGPGDLLRVAVWEPNQQGTSLAADKTAMETITRVDIDGTVSVPYIGRVHVAGHTPADIESNMRGQLANQSPGAQVAVLVTEDLTNNIVVQGLVAKPGRYAVVPNSSGVLDVLAMAGGAQTLTHQAVVRVTRDGTAVTRTLSSMVDAHALEADLAPGDRILVQARDAYFFAFGAVNHPGEQLYDADAISLTRTLARIEGLADSRADPAEVFVYRRQAADLTQALMQAAAAAGTPVGTVPGQDLTHVIYRLNLRAGGGFFVGAAFPVLPNDLIYVSESPVAEISKVFQILTGASAVGAIPHNLGVPY